MQPSVSNLLRGPFPRTPDEQFDTLVMTERVHIERIVSTGQSTPEGEWYDQDRDEWVAVIQGRAALRFADHDEPIEMTAGDWLRIPAHCRHRVESTDAPGPTVWLAVHFDA